MLAHVGGPVLAPLQLAPAALAAVLYAVRARTLARRGRPVPAERQACWYGGLAVVVLTLTSPLAHIADELFLAHMAEHLLIADLGALLLVVGLTGPVLQPLLRIRALDRLRVLTHPLVALPLWAVSLYLWHLDALYVGSVDHPALHALQHACFVGFGVAMWMPLLGPLPKPAWFGNLARLVYIIVVRLTGAVLANVLVWSNTVFYPGYAGERSWGITALQDQNVAGAIMMVEGSLLTIGLFCWLFLRAAREGEERQALLDLAAQRGVALSDRRAARAVAAGRGAELRRRLEEDAPSR
ncbi:MAG TPA: cytochrome c oxidase assembly protein [Solirubrobacteraceae bacterium]